MIDTARTLKLPALAPLTPPIAIHLASYIVRTAPRDAGRPSGPTRDVAHRAELRLLAALESLVPKVEQARQEVFSEMDETVRSSSLTPSWLLQALAHGTGNDKIIYPQRLVDWRREGVLHYNRRVQPDAQSVASVLVARRIDLRRKGWLPSQLDQYESRLGWVCWRQVQPGLDPEPYPLELTEDGDVELPSEQSLLWTPWTGAAWLGWLEVPGGAITWSVPEQATFGLLEQWAPQLVGSSDKEQDPTELSTQVLRHLAADRLPSHPPATSG